MNNDDELELGPREEALVQQLADEAAHPKFDEETRGRIDRAESLPPADPHLYSDHGYGVGPLDGIEDWNQFWGDFDLGVQRQGGGGGFDWKIRRLKLNGQRLEAPFIVPASGHEDTIEAAGLRVLEWCKSYADLPGPV